MLDLKNMQANEILDELQEMKEKIEARGRKPNDAERNLAAVMLDRLEEVEAKNKQRLENYQPCRPPVEAGGGFTRMTTKHRNFKPYELRSPGDPKDHKSIFGEQPVSFTEWRDKNSNFFQAVFSGRMHPELRAMVEGVQSDGGFLVPTQYERQILDVALESEIVRSRAYVQPMNTLELNIPGFEIGDHSTGELAGGFKAYYIAETQSLTKKQPKTRAITLKAKKLTGLVRMSNELIADSGGADRIMNLCSNGLAYYHDRAFLKGTGAGEPLGVLNANCLIKVDKETGQDGGTILYENLVKMMAKIYAGSFQRSIWVCHQTTIPQLLQLSIPVGTGGSHYSVLKESNGGFSMLTRPVIFTEKTETVGSQGDILLADFSQYIIALRDGLRMDYSPHVHFETDETLGRLIERHDGQPLWNKALTLEDGSKVSPFVVLKART